MKILIQALIPEETNSILSAKCKSLDELAEIAGNYIIQGIEAERMERRTTNNDQSKRSTQGSDSSLIEGPI